MKLYIKSKIIKEPTVTFGYRELAEKMWFKPDDGKELEISHVGNDETLQGGLYLSIKLDKWLNDERWNKIRSSLTDEHLDMEMDLSSKIISIKTTHINILTADKRALYILVSEITKACEGTISEDEQQTWIGIEEFENQHQDILLLSYDEANVISLEEVKTMEAIKEPWEWDEE